MLPLFALLLAVGAYAFQSSQQNAVSPAKSTTSNSDLHWFRINGGTLQYDGLRSKESEMDLTQCQDNSDDICARGYTQQQLVGGSPANGPVAVEQSTEEIYRTE